jgi:A/G-specific adenine glycosylase
MRSARAALFEWYRPRRRTYPWRRTSDPYAVLVSEVMLQQTQAPRVAASYERFLARFPTVAALAESRRSDVVRAWDGLGYNRRPVALSLAARAIARDHGGVVPSDPDALRSLPGVGPYTAGAVASIAFGRRVAAVDTNVRRIVARVHLGTDADPAASRVVQELAVAWVDAGDPGAWNQALMDLGREVCRPRPRCDACPLARTCRFRATDAVPSPPRRRQGPFPGSSRQVRGGVVRVLRDLPAATLGAIALDIGADAGRVLAAVRDLHREGVVHAGPAALAGRPTGRVRLAN